MQVLALGMSKRIPVSLPVVKQREDIKAVEGAHSTFYGLSLLGFQPLFLPQSTNKNRRRPHPHRWATVLSGSRELSNAVFSPSAALLSPAPRLALSTPAMGRPHSSLPSPHQEEPGGKE